MLKNISITFTENVMTKGLNFLIILMLTRALGPADYGKYSFIYVAIALCSALFDFGMENTAVRFTAREQSRQKSIFGLYLIAKLLILLGLTVLLAVGGDWLLAWMGKAEISRYLPFLMIGLIGESLFLVNDSYLQSQQRFRLRAILNVTRYATALLYIAILMTGNWLSLEWVVYVYLVPAVFSLLFAAKYLSFLKAYLLRPLRPKLLQSIAGYERWMLVYSVANNLLGRIDFLMLGFWVGFQQLGIYNAAFQLCAIVSFLPLVVGKVLLPTLSELDEAQIFQTTARIVGGTTLMSILAVLLIPLSAWIVPGLLGEDYANAVPVLQILLLAFVCSLMSMPYEQALYSLGQPKILSICRYMQLALIVALNMLAIPMFGIYGAAVTAMVGRLMYLLIVRRFYAGFQSALPASMEVR